MAEVVRRVVETQLTMPEGFAVHPRLAPQPARGKQSRVMLQVLLEQRVIGGGHRQAKRARRLEAGETVVGKKIGATSKPVQDMHLFGPLLERKKAPWALKEDGSLIAQAPASLLVVIDTVVANPVISPTNGRGDISGTGEPGAIPAVGGAMDLAVGAKQTWVMMDVLTKQGVSKLVEQCSYPLTGLACVKRVYTDLATLACTPDGLQLIDLVPGLTHEALEEMIGLPIAAAKQGEGQ